MTAKTKLTLITIAVAILVASAMVTQTVKSIDTQKTTPPSPPPRSGPIQVALVGDSITGDYTYPSDLQEMLGDNYSVGNFGSSGSTVSLSSWKPYMDQPVFQSALNFEPNIVVIMLGTNDDLQSLHQYNQTFQSDYAQLICAFQKLASKPQIWIATSPPIFSNSTDLSPAYMQNTIIPLTEGLAIHMNLPIINVNAAFGNQSSYFQSDGVHPNSQGSAFIANQVYLAITQK